jgi:hypothetical protein
MNNIALGPASAALFDQLFKASTDAQIRLQAFLQDTAAAMGVEGNDWTFNVPTKCFQRTPPAHPVEPAEPATASA